MKDVHHAGSSPPGNDEGHDAPNIAAPRDHENKCLNFKRITAPPQAADTDRTGLHRALVARLARLGLAHSSLGDGGVLIAGRAYDMRQAIVMARQIGRLAA